MIESPWTLWEDLFGASSSLTWFLFVWRGHTLYERKLRQHVAIFQTFSKVWRVYRFRCTFFQYNCVGLMCLKVIQFEEAFYLVSMKLCFYVMDTNTGRFFSCSGREYLRCTRFKDYLLFCRLFIHFEGSFIVWFSLCLRRCLWGPVNVDLKSLRKSSME